MTTMDMSLFEIMSRKIAMAATRRRERSRSVPRTWMQATVRLVLHLAGFSCFTIAGFSVSLPAGLIIAGVSCFCLSYLATAKSADSTVTGR